MVFVLSMLLGAELHRKKPGDAFAHRVLCIAILVLLFDPPEFSRTKPGPKLLFVSGGSARQRGNRKRKKF